MRGLLLILLTGVLAGCRSAGRGLVDDDPSYKVPAIKAAVVGDREATQNAAVPQLVSSLDDDDAAVRFYAIEGLRRLTGKDFDYHYYEDAATRRPAVGRWKQWLGEWSARPRTAAENPAAVRSPYDRPPED